MSRWSYWYPLLTAIAALLLGCMIYLFARPSSIIFSGVDVSVPLGDHMPSVLHTFGFALLSSLVITRRFNAIVIILAWGAVEVLAELAQYNGFPIPQILDNYQQASTFDLLDLAAILSAVCLAILLTRMTRYR